MPTLCFWPLTDVTSAGPDPFGSVPGAEEAAVGRAHFALRPGAAMRFIDLPDDGGAEADAPAIEPDVSYLIRPLASEDVADTAVVHLIDTPATGRGLASSERLKPGRAYRITGLEAEGMLTPFASQSICFAAGTLIATRRGPKPVEELTPEDPLQTSDNGYRPVQWVGRWRVGGLGAAAPVRFAPGVLGNDRALFVSGQHRVLIRPTTGPLAGEEVLVAAKALVGLPGIARAPCERVEWVHVMMPTHEVIFAESARAESMLAGHKTMMVMEPTQAKALRQSLSHDPFTGLPARPIVPTPKVEKLILQHRRGHTPLESAGLMRR
ncbi:Hint domain-containing protein [Rhodobacter viridis]|uniref:Hint domain-containing protein n=1 Tax=Rhodobacter viridis TaxID=1054202 RepID=A0A318U1M6_9RHOB|nr:Hint domain-containing protein [Rhodobacter viridis]PYF10201.1 Hint domain-containing protein [Rhodobacter viridis]